MSPKPRAEGGARPTLYLGRVAEEVNYDQAPSPGVKEPPQASAHGLAAQERDPREQEAREGVRVVNVDAWRGKRTPPLSDIANPQRPWGIQCGGRRPS